MLSWETIKHCLVVCCSGNTEYDKEVDSHKIVSRELNIQVAIKLVHTHLQSHLIFCSTYIDISSFF